MPSFNVNVWNQSSDTLTAQFRHETFFAAQMRYDNIISDYKREGFRVTYTENNYTEITNSNEENYAVEIVSN